MPEADRPQMMHGTGAASAAHHGDVWCARYLTIPWSSVQNSCTLKPARMLLLADTARLHRSTAGASNTARGHALAYKGTGVPSRMLSAEVVTYRSMNL